MKYVIVELVYRVNRKFETPAISHGEEFADKRLNGIQTTLLIFICHTKENSNKNRKRILR